MVVAEDISSIPYSVEKEVPKPRLAYDEMKRLMKIVKMKGLDITESQLLMAVYTGCDLFLRE